MKAQALEKMLKEMMEKHTPSEDKIHNFLCEQDDIKLFEGILKENNSIKGSLNYCSNKARQFASNKVAIIDDQTVYGWVIEYFTNQKETKEDNGPKESTLTSVPKSKKSKKISEDIQLSLF